MYYFRCDLDSSHVNHVVIKVLPFSYNSKKKKTKKTINFVATMRAT